MEPQAPKHDVELILNDSILSAPPESPAIPVECALESRKYIGTFTFRRPGLYVRAGIGARTAELQSVWNPQTLQWERRSTDFAYQVMAEEIATLEHVVVQHPAWWQLENLTDPSVVHAVFEVYMKWQGDFRGPLAKPPAASPGAPAK